MIEIIEKILLMLIAAIMTALLSYYFGSKIYYKQKEYENIRKRYLDEGFDKLISEYEFALSAYRHNWLIGLSILQQIRDLPRETINTKLLEDFISLKNIILPTISVHRLNNLISIDDLWKKHQALFSFVQGCFTTFTCDLYVAVTCYINNPEKLNVTNDVLFDEFFSKLQEMNKRSVQHDHYLGQIKNLSTIFENNVFYRKDMKEFKTWEEVKEILEKLKCTKKQDA